MSVRRILAKTIDTDLEYEAIGIDLAKNCVSAALLTTDGEVVCIDRLDVYQIKQLIYESPVPDSRLQHCRREYLSSQHSPLLSHNDYQSSHRDR